MERNNHYERYCAIVPEKECCYFVMEDYTKSKGSGLGKKQMYKTVEMWPGAWECYLADLRETSRTNWLKTCFHCEYLDLRDEVVRGEKTAEDALAELKLIRDWFVGGVNHGSTPTTRISKSWCATYTKHLRTREDWVGTRIKMQF